MDFSGLATRWVNGGIAVEEAIQQYLNLLPAVWIDAVADGGAFYLSLYDADGFEFAQVLGYRRLCKSNFVHDGTGDAGMAGYQILQYGDACRMRQCFAEGGQLILGRREEVGFGYTHFSIIYCNITIKEGNLQNRMEVQHEINLVK